VGSSTGRKKNKSAQPPPIRTTAVPDAETFGHELANWMFPGYLALMLLGMILIRQFGMTAGSTNGVRALFIAVNAGTLTGFSDITGLAALNGYGQCFALLLIVGGSLFNMIIGALAVKRIARLRVSDGRIIAAAFIVELAAILIGGTLLEGERSVFHAIFLAASAFGNCGVYPAELPADSDILVHAVILPLTILGGLGLPVLMEIADTTLYRKPLSSHSRAVLGVSAWLYVIGLAALLVLILVGQPFSAQNTVAAVRQSSVLAIESRTGGMEISPARLVSESGRWVLIALMMIGASPAGTGSGLKTTTIAELFRGIRRLLDAQPVGRSMGIAVTWVGSYLAMLLGAVILLSHVNPVLSTDHALFSAVSALSNVGFSLSEIPDRKNVLFAYCAIMLLGRMVPLMILWWMAETTTDADLAVG
jgi:trk system potassium uptake protein TrkH